METNPYRYDTYPSFGNSQQQSHAARVRLAPGEGSVLSGRFHTEAGAQKSSVVGKMPKARALALAQKLKRGVVVASVLGFGAISGLIAFQQSAAATATTSSTTSNSSQSSQSNSPSSSSSQDSGSFWGQQGRNNFGDQNSSQGSGVSNSSSQGTNNGSSGSSQPVSGTHTS